MKESAINHTKDIVYFVKDTSVNEELRYSFTNGVVGQQIREMFNNKCKYEE